jgi:hypothetical protein
MAQMTKRLLLLLLLLQRRRRLLVRASSLLRPLAPCRRSSNMPFPDLLSPHSKRNPLMTKQLLLLPQPLPQHPTASALHALLHFTYHHLQRSRPCRLCQ